MEIPYDESKKERDKIVAEREKKLYQSFENMRKQIDEQIQTMNFSTVSERVKRQQLEEIRNELQKHLQAHYNALESGLKDDMVNIGQSVLNESESFYKGLNMPIGMSITSFPVEIMNNVVNGSVYQEKWYLSRALWGDYTEKLDQINEVISNGIGLNLSSFEIAKQLEQYVDPSAMTPSKTIVTHCLQDPVSGKLYSKDYVKRHPEKDWSGFKEKDSKFRYGKVDYNAQRLARTLINHAYQQNVVHQAKANPFATGVRWDASGGERMCEICEERDGKIFPADEVPLDHPNGMCTFEVVTDLSMMEMSNVLADFVNGEPTEYDDKLYAWYNDRAEVPIERAPDMLKQYFEQFTDKPKIEHETIGRVVFGGKVIKEGRVEEYSQQYQGNGESVTEFFAQNTNYKTLIENMSKEERQAFEKMWSSGKFMKGQQYGAFSDMTAKEQFATRVFDKYLDQAVLNKGIQVMRLSDAQLVLGYGNSIPSLEKLQAMQGKQVICNANMSFSAASQGLRISSTGQKPTVEYKLKIPEGATGCGMYIGDRSINVWGNKQREFMTNRDIWLTVGEASYDTERDVYQVEIEFGGVMEHNYE